MGLEERIYSLSLGQCSRDSLVMSESSGVHELGRPSESEEQWFLASRELFLGGEVEHQVCL